MSDDETVQNLGGRTERVCHRALDSGGLRSAGPGFGPQVLDGLFWPKSELPFNWA
jgi:hypothetical protein